jgi:hypothetical protein
VSVSRLVDFVLKSSSAPTVVSIRMYGNCAEIKVRRRDSVVIAETAKRLGFKVVVSNKRSTVYSIVRVCED